MDESKELECSSKKSHAKMSFVVPLILAGEMGHKITYLRYTYYKVSLNFALATSWGLEMVKQSFKFDKFETCTEILIRFVQTSSKKNNNADGAFDGRLAHLKIPTSFY